MVICSFCNAQFPQGTGLTLFKKDGMPKHYCSHKCTRNSEIAASPPSSSTTKA